MNTSHNLSNSKTILKEKPIRKFEGMLPSETLHSTLIKPRQE
jgi:hypothetical protein